MNALMYAVTNRNYACAKELVDYIKDHCDDTTNKTIINQHNEIKETSILMTAKNNDTSLFRLVYDINNADVNHTDIYGYSSLHYSIGNHNSEIFDTLINYDATNINIQDLEGNTPLIYSVKKGNDIGTYKLLVCDKVDMNKTNNYEQNIIGYILQQKYSSDFKNDDKQSLTGFMGVDKKELAAYPDALSPDNLLMNMVDSRSIDFMSDLPLHSKIKLQNLIN